MLRSGRPRARRGRRAEKADPGQRNRAHSRHPGDFLRQRRDGGRPGPHRRLLAAAGSGTRYRRRRSRHAAGGAGGGASMASRFLFARLNELMGRARLTTLSTFASAASYIALALPFPLAAMYVVIAAAGFALSISDHREHRQPARTRQRGGARHRQLAADAGKPRRAIHTIPFLAGLIAAVTTAALPAIFLIIGVSLAASAAAVQVRLRRVNWSRLAITHTQMRHNDGPRDEGEEHHDRIQSDGSWHVPKGIDR